MARPAPWVASAALAVQRWDRFLQGGRLRSAVPLQLAQHPGGAEDRLRRQPVPNRPDGHHHGIERRGTSALSVDRHRHPLSAGLLQAGRGPYCQSEGRFLAHFFECFSFARGSSCNGSVCGTACSAQEGGRAPAPAPPPPTVSVSSKPDHRVLPAMGRHPRQQVK